MCLYQDEDIYRFFEPNLPAEAEEGPSQRGGERRLDHHKGLRGSDRIYAAKAKIKIGDHHLHRKSSGLVSGSPECYRLSSSREKGSGDRRSVDSEDSGRSGEYVSILDLNGDHYFSCAVGRRRSQARFSMNTSEEVVSMLQTLAGLYNQKQ